MENTEVVSELEVMGNRIHELMSMWEAGVRATKSGYLLMGKAMFYIKKERIWQYHTEHVPSFKYWVEHELHISLAQANRLAEIWTEVGHLIEDMPLDISKITLLLPHLHNKTDEQKVELLNMARGCNLEGIKNNLLTYTGFPERATDVCEHRDVELMPRCRNCGKWLHNHVAS